MDGVCKIPRVESFQSQGLINISMRRYLLDNLEEAKTFVVKLYVGVSHPEIPLIELNQGSGGSVRHGIFSEVGMFGVGLVGYVDLALEELVEVLEVLSDFVGNVIGMLQKERVN